VNSVDYIKQFPLKEFTRGKVLAQKGDTIDALLAVRTGYVKVTSISNDGSERLVWIAGRYDFVPTEQLFSRAPEARFFYTALTDGSYYEIDKSAFLKTLNEEPTLMKEVARGMSDHYDDFLYRVDAVDTATVKERLLRTLCYLAERVSPNQSVDVMRFGLRLTHGELASMIGSTRETTSVMLNESRKEGLIEYSRKHFIVHVQAIQGVLETTTIR
jgi:CRP/FNR family cyclic AMP-dependent transcriptional regulator